MAHSHMCLLVVSAFACVMAAHAAVYSTSMIVLGDSISDNQAHLRNLSNGVMPAPDGFGLFYGGRFCNGPMWDDHLQNITDLTVRSLAIGGAGSCKPTELSVVTVPSGEQQYGNFFIDSPDIPGASNPRILTVFLGHNDVFTYAPFLNQVFDPTSTLASIDPFLSYISYCIVQTVQMGLYRGERRVLVISLVPMDQSPGFISTPLFAEAFKSINSRVKALVPKLYKPLGDAQEVVYIDMYAKLSRVLDNSVAYGFKNIKETCINGTGFSFTPSNVLISLCPKPDDYFWYVDIHPSSSTHKIIADNIAIVLRKRKWIK